MICKLVKEFCTGNLGGQGKVREFWMESGEKEEKKKREINKGTRKKEREIGYIIKSNKKLL